MPKQPKTLTSSSPYPRPLHLLHLPLSPQSPPSQALPNRYQIQPRPSPEPTPLFISSPQSRTSAAPPALSLSTNPSRRPPSASPPTPAATPLHPPSPTAQQPTHLHHPSALISPAASTLSHTNPSRLHPQPHQPQSRTSASPPPLSLPNISPTTNFSPLSSPEPTPSPPPLSCRPPHHHP